MPKVASIISSQISGISKKELEKLVLKAAAKNKSFHDYLLVNYFDKEFGEQDLFEEAKKDLDILIRKNYKGFSEELQLANMLAACGKRIVEFSKSCKNKNLEADLLLHVLQIPFSLSEDMLGTCFTAYNYKIVLLLKRLINLVKSKMHPDFMIEYRPLINGYLATIHRTSSHLDYINDLPETI